MAERYLVRLCSAEDLDDAELHMPSGPSRFHHRRYAQQLAGESQYLLAWADGLPVGHLNLLTKSKYPEVAERFGEFPEMNALGVHGPLWGRGIGTALIRASEQLARQAGARQIGLAVGVTNDRADRLYEYLGYAEARGLNLVDAWHWIDPDGVRHEQQDPCRYRTRNLKPDPTGLGLPT